MYLVYSVFKATFADKQNYHSRMQSYYAFIGIHIKRRISFFPAAWMRSFSMSASS